MEEGCEVWRSMGGWTSKLGRVYMVAVCGEIVVWVGRHFAKILGLRLGWRIQ